MLNPVHLRTLQAVVRTGSFADAGRSLGWTGSAVSQQVAALERQLRTALFERDAHGVRPTPAALFIAEQASSALTGLEALEEDISAYLDGAVGTLRLGSFPSASERLLPAALSAFSRRNPQVRVHLEEGEPADLVPMLRQRELDLALVYRYDLVPWTWPTDLTMSPLLTEQLMLLAPRGHRLAGAGHVEMADLADETWISTRRETAMATNLDRLCAEAGFEPTVTCRSNDYDVIRALVTTGLGVAIVPALALPPDLGVAVVGLTDDGAERNVSALRSPAAPAAVVDEAARALRAAATTVCATTDGAQVAS